MTDVSPPGTVQSPRQERSRASFERVLTAATSLLEEEGFDGFTLAGVSKRAGVSIGSIYARVKSKDDLLYVVQDRYMAETEDRPILQDTDAWQSLSPGDVVVRLVEEFGEVFHQNERLLRVFMHRGIADPVVAARSSASVTRYHDQVEMILLGRRSEIVHDDAKLAIGVTFRMAWGTLARRIMQGPTFESPRAIAWESLVTELGLACAAYLFGATRGSSLSRSTASVRGIRQRRGRA